MQSLQTSLTLSIQHPLSLSLSLRPLNRPPPSTTIRMGGGPRTYPGGVSKWQWKRMQAKKSKQLLKARLCRERQIYEMRKRAELKAAVSDLERPWEVVDTAAEKAAAPLSSLFSVKADEQLKVLADRFQRPGGFDLWSEDDGPQLFETPDDGLLPTARFFPKGVVHSVKPYGRVHLEEESSSESWRKGRNDANSTRVSRGGKVRNGSLVSGSDEKFDGENSDFSDEVGSSNWRRGRNEANSTRGIRSGKLRNASFDSGSDEKLDGENSDFSDEAGSSNWRRGRNEANSTRGFRGGKLGNASFDSESDGKFDGENSDFSDEVGSSNWGFRSGKLGNASFDSESGKKLDGENSENGRRWSKNRNRSHYRKNGIQKTLDSENEHGNKLMDSRPVRDSLEERRSSSEMRSNSRKWSSRGRNSGRSRGLHSEYVHDMSLRHDGSYGLRAGDEDV